MKSSSYASLPAPPASQSLKKTGLLPWQAGLGVALGGAGAHGAGTVASLAVVLGVAFQHGPEALESLLTSDPAASATAILPVLLAASLIATEGMLILAAVLTPLFARVRLKDALGLALPSPTLVAAGVLGVVGLGPLGDGIAWAADQYAPWASLGALPALSQSIAVMPLGLTLLVAAVLPGIGEELFFRGLLQRAVGRGALAILISGVVFAVFHVDPHHVVATLPIGFYLAWLAARADSSIPSIIAHAANNALAIVGLQLSVAAQHPLDSRTPHTPELGWILGGLALAVVSILIVEWLRRPAAPSAEGYPRLPSAISEA
jgi:membrane protease YdiL (CAAX protease family)